MPEGPFSQEAVGGATPPPVPDALPPTPLATLSYQDPTTALGVANPVGQVSFAFYISLMVALLFLVTMNLAVQPSEIGNNLMVGGGLASLLGMVIYAAVIVYRGWRMLPNAAAGMHPGLAVGLLFIPLFNIYWVFPAIYGWSRRYNRSLAAANHQAPRASEGSFLTLCILFALSVTPCMCGLLFMLPTLLLQPVVIWQMCRAINFYAQTAEPPSGA